LFVGPIAGIVIGAVILVLIIVVLMVVCFVCGRRSVLCGLQYWFLLLLQPKRIIYVCVFC